MSDITAILNVLRNPNSSLSDKENSCGYIVGNIEKPEVLRAIATQKDIDAMADVMKGPQIVEFVKILHKLAGTEYGMAALEESVFVAIKSGKQCWVHALGKVLQFQPSLEWEHCLETLLKFASRSSRCAASLQAMKGVISVLKKNLTFNDMKRVDSALDVLRALSGSCSAIAELVVRENMHSTLLDMLQKGGGGGGIRKSWANLLELIACLATLSVDFATKFIENDGLRHVRDKGYNSLIVNDKVACAHALGALTRGVRLDAIVDEEKFKVVDTLLNLVNDPSSKDIQLYDQCFRGLLNFVQSDSAMAHIEQVNKLTSINVINGLPSQAEFNEKYDTFVRERKEAESESPNDEDAECVITWESAPPQKRVATMTAAEKKKAVPSHLLAITEEENYTLNPTDPITLLIDKDFIHTFKAPETFREAFDKLGYPESVYTLCDNTARKALEDRALKSKLGIADAQAIALYTVASVPGGGGATPAAVLAEIFKKGDLALVGKWESYISLLWRAMCKLKPDFRDKCCCSRGDFVISGSGNRVYFPSFFCTTSDANDVESLLGDGKGVVFSMKQTFGYDVSMLAVPDENGQKPSELFIHVLGCVFDVEGVSNTGNVKQVTLKFKECQYET